MKLPNLKIGDIVAKVPIIQGGMGIGVSMSSLAAAVANEGGIGIISSAQIGFKEPDFKTNTFEANIRGMIKEIRKARELSPSGIIGVNIMTAGNHFKEMVETVCQEGIDLIISGAGLPLDLPELCTNPKTKLVPIVSSAKAATLILRAWFNRYSRLPDAVVVEGPEAGGHLGFSNDDIESEGSKLENILPGVVDVVKSYEEKHNVNIPVIAAGGIYTGADIAKFLKLGASGVQMASRFVATHECDASLNYKMAYVNSKEDDIIIIKSPVGMPGRAIKNKFIETVAEQRIDVKKCFKCLRKCSPATTPYCITNALITAVEGDVENGLVFSGSTSYKIDKIVSVKELINELVTEASAIPEDESVVIN